MNFQKKNIKRAIKIERKGVFGWGRVFFPSGQEL